MKMSATAYFLSFVIKNQFAVDCRFCSQNFSFYTSTKTKYAQVMSKLWLSKNRTQHSNQIVWFSIGMQEKRGEEEKNDNDSASTMWWLVWHIFYLWFYWYIHESHDVIRLMFATIYSSSFHSDFFCCVHFCVFASCLFNTSLFLHILNQKNIYYNVCVMSLCVCRFQWKTYVSRLIYVFSFFLSPIAFQPKCTRTKHERTHKHT